jgi:hypothetical protein
MSSQRIAVLTLVACAAGWAGCGGMDSSKGSAFGETVEEAPDAGTTPQSTAFALYDDFNDASFNITSDGVTTPNGRWKVGYLGFGFARTEPSTGDALDKCLVMSPKRDVLRAARLDTTRSWKGIHGRMRVRLDQQLQPPVGWYTLWPFIAYVDETTHYYFNLKTNGWELGKKDNDHPPAEELQKFIRTGTSPKAVIGQWHTLEWWVVPDSTVDNLRIRVDVDGVRVVDVLDDEPWQRDGTSGTGASTFFLNADKKVALYSEASQVSWDDVYLGEATGIP